MKKKFLQTKAFWGHETTVLRIWWKISHVDLSDVLGLRENQRKHGKSSKNKENKQLEHLKSF